MVDLAIVEMLFDRHLQPSWTFPRPEVFLYLASALLTITIGIILGSTIRLTQRTKLARRIALEVAWPLCASIFILASTNAQQTLPGTLGLVPAYTFIGFAMLWLIAKVLRFIIGFLTDPDLLTARLTIWWKLAHVKRGTYQTAVRELHAKHGELIQVGPYEYSLSNPAYFERCAKFPKVCDAKGCQTDAWLTLKHRPHHLTFFPVALFSQRHSISSAKHSRWPISSATKLISKPATKG